ncbi:MAG TPA: galactosyltransferase-related protein [Bryobacteraceae bacterium]|nr:galactosyltransferase-related protein [Bryobacteraceae bacterium]
MLSIIVTWRDRAELSRALPGLMECANALDGDLTIVNYSGSSSMLQSQIGDHWKRVHVIEVAGQKYFHKACAQNIGVANTSSELLFFCDADIILDPLTLTRLTEQVLEKPDTFGTLTGVRETENNARGGNNVVCFGYELQVRIANGRILKIVDHEEDAEDGTRNAPGLILVRRKHFLEIQGYNSDLHGWGWEDQDMIGRLTLGAGLRRVMSGYAVHISHEDSLRIANYPVSNRWESRDKMFRQALANYDRNYFLGTYSSDVRQIPVRRVAGGIARNTAAT